MKRYAEAMMVEVFEKPPKMKLISAAEDFFRNNPSRMVVGLRTKEGREFWFRRDPYTGKPIKISRAEAEKL